MDSSLADHRQSASSSYKCQECDFKGNTISSLRTHITLMHVKPEEKPFPCKNSGCNARFTLKSNLRYHIRHTHAENQDKLKVHKCNQCSYKAYDQGSIRLHSGKHSDERPFACDFPSCGYRAKRQETLRMHKKCHDPDPDKLKVHSCTLCGKRFRFRSNLEVLMRTHTGDKPYTCDFSGCHYRSSQLGEVKRHRRKHDPHSILKCTFPGCDYQTTLRPNLRSHQETHNPERKRDLQCPLCPKKFARRECLNSHIKKVHTKERPISCSHCDSTFTSAFNLRLHTVQVHKARTAALDTILKKFKCTACDYLSTSRTDVLRHQRCIHFNAAKSFGCHNCNFRTKFRRYLQSHQNRCPGLPPVQCFGCQFCEKKYSTNSSLQLHLKTIHRPDKLKCPKCEFVTNYPANLRHHLKKLHTEGSEDNRGIDDQKKGAAVAVHRGGRLLGTRSSASKVRVKAPERCRNAQKWFKCEFPGCSFGAPLHCRLKPHEIRHRPEMKNIQCPMCPRKFYLRNELNVHVYNVHTKEKPFKCDECDYSASSRYIVREHKRKVHAGNSARKSRDGVEDGDKNDLVPARHLGVAQFYLCPFCGWMHSEYTAIVRHTVAHRFPVVSLKAMEVKFQ